MSILLEALKKSEAQRQLGAAPTLQTPASVAGSPHAAWARWLPAGMAVVAVCAMAWLGWAQFSPPEASPDLATSQAPMPSDSVPAQATAAANSAEANSQAIANDAQPPSLVSMGVQRKSSSDEVAEKRKLLGKSFRSYSAETQDEGDAPEPAADAQEPGRAEFREPSAGPAEALAADVQDAAPRTQPGDAPAGDTISYWQIPNSLRQGMPELHIRVLVYANRPEDRFLLINDQRLREGDEIESGLRLEEIQRDRAIFSYRNYRFHLKG